MPEYYKFPGLLSPSQGLKFAVARSEKRPKALEAVSSETDLLNCHRELCGVLNIRCIAALRLLRTLSSF